MTSSYRPGKGFISNGTGSQGAPCRPMLVSPGHILNDFELLFRASPSLARVHIMKYGKVQVLASAVVCGDEREEAMSSVRRHCCQEPFHK